MRASMLGPALAAGALCFAVVALAAAGQGIVVKITDLAFSPETVAAKVGDTIEWVNEDFLDHTATAEDESFDLAIAAGRSVRLEVRRSGAVAYFCRIHPNMRGTINVD